MDVEKLLSLMETGLSSAADFWLKNGTDTEHGGIYHCLDKDGRIFSLDKGVWIQGRAGWALSYLYNCYEKRGEFLRIAKSCIDFCRERCIDTDGRMFVKVAKDGTPLEKSTDWFSEAFYVMANAEYYRATGDVAYLLEARKYYDLISAIHADPSADPYRVTAGGSPMGRATRPFNRPMILLNLSSVMAAADPERIGLYNTASARLADEIRDFYKPEYHATLEAVATDGSVITDSATMRVCCPGHDMECAWFLYEEGKRLGRTDMCELAVNIFDDAYAMGYDAEYGGILYYKDITGAPVEAYEQDMKIWWVHNEAIVASMMLALDGRGERYFDILADLVEYSFAHFVDTDGEWFASLRRDGAPNETRIKGFIYKGPFHTLRMYVKCIEMLKGR